MSNEVFGTWKTKREFYLDAALHYYPRYYDDDDIRSMVEHNTLTPEDFTKVTGKKYTPRDKDNSSSSTGSTGSTTNSLGSNTSSSNASAGDKSK